MLHVLTLPWKPDRSFHAGRSRTADPELEQHQELSTVDGPGGHQHQLLHPAHPDPLPGNPETHSQLSQENISKWDRYFFCCFKTNMSKRTVHRSVRFVLSCNPETCHYRVLCEQSWAWLSSKSLCGESSSPACSIFHSILS